jgi:hypothetical protein
MNKCITVYYSEAKDLTKIKFTDLFENADWLLKADVLKDAIHELTDAYNKTLEDRYD